MKTVAVIPARAGSKGLPGKNLRTVGGQSLVARAIKAATHANIFSNIVVSTDGEEIAEEARQNGAQVVLRPPEFATDSARTIDAVCHALETLDVNDGICVLLQPTSPLRTAADIIEAIEKKKVLGLGSVLSVCECEHHPLKTFELQGDQAVPVRELSFLEAPRQSLPKMYRPNGAIYVNDIGSLFQARSFFISPIAIIEMSTKRSVDIDSETDLILATQLLENN